MRRELMSRVSMKMEVTQIKGGQLAVSYGNRNTSTYEMCPAVRRRAAAARRWSAVRNYVNECNKQREERA